MNDKQTARKSARTKPKNKFHLDYWREAVFHPTSLRDGKKYVSPNWMAALSHKGTRESLSLETDNREAAAARALEMFIYLKANGWEKWKAQYKPDSIKPEPKREVTVGAYLKAVQPLIVCDPKTFEQYAQAFRRIAASVGDVDDRGQLGHDEWHSQVEAVNISAFTENAVRRWQHARLAEAGNSPAAKLRSGSSINSNIRMAKALFSRQIVKKLKGVVLLPDPLPFTDCQKEKQTNCTYRRTFDVSQLANDARSELAGTELYKIFVLALIFGLRRREIDLLEWPAFRLNEGVLRIAVTENASLKSKSSASDLPIDQDAKTLIQEWKAKAKSSFVVESTAELRLDSLRYQMRCHTLFVELNKWLRKHGVKGRTPLHTLRKEYGSILCDTFGIHVAKTALRHSNIQTTAAHYDSDKSVALPNAGLLLKGPPDNVVQIKEVA